jgi:hypothetical protein
MTQTSMTRVVISLLFAAYIAGIYFVYTVENSHLPKSPVYSDEEDSGNGTKENNESIALAFTL